MNSNESNESIYLSIYLCLSIYLPTFIYVYLCIYICISMYIYLFIYFYLSIYLSIYLLVGHDCNFYGPQLWQLAFHLFSSLPTHGGTRLGVPLEGTHVDCELPGDGIQKGNKPPARKMKEKSVSLLVGPNYSPPHVNRSKT